MQNKDQNNGIGDGRATLRARLSQAMAAIPMIGWLLGIAAAVLVEYALGAQLAYQLYLPKMPALFGFTIALKQPQLVPAALAYVFLVYALPLILVSRLTAPWTNRLAAALERTPTWMSALIHLALLYAALHVWADLSDYRLQVVKLTMIAVMMTLSINVINGYMGEFSCSHPGFMALGAYAASTISLVFFTQDRLFGAALLPPAWGPFFFPLALVARAREYQRKRMTAQRVSRPPGASP